MEQVLDQPGSERADFVVWLGNGGGEGPGLGVRVMAGLQSQVHSRGGIWTHFPDRVTYRYTEVRLLEPT
jgi:hypothetical protein